VPDFDDVREAVRRADLAALQRFLDEGWDVNERQHWSGRTALQLAAGADNAYVVEFLLRHGADPNSCDNDGYFAYDGTSWRVRELMLAYGFSWGQWQPREYATDTVAQLRVLAPREPATGNWTETVTNTGLFVEHIVLELPVPVGAATVSVTLDGRESYTATLAAPGHQCQRLTAGDTAAAQAAVTVHCDRFVGEFYVRLFSSTAVDRLEGARTFWRPDYTTYQVARA
jgi:hypothetical protein